MLSGSGASAGVSEVGPRASDLYLGEAVRLLGCGGVLSAPHFLVPSCLSCMAMRHEAEEARTGCYHPSGSTQVAACVASMPLPGPPSSDSVLIATVVVVVLR